MAFLLYFGLVLMCYGEAGLYRCWANGVVSRGMQPNLVDALAASVTDGIGGQGHQYEC